MSSISRGCTPLRDGLLDRGEPDARRLVEDVRLLRGKVDGHLFHPAESPDHLLDAGHARRARHAFNRDCHVLVLLGFLQAVTGRLHCLADSLHLECALVELDVQLLGGQVHGCFRDSLQLSHDPLHARRAGRAGHSRDCQVFGSQVHHSFDTPPPRGRGVHPI